MMEVFWTQGVSSTGDRTSESVEADDSSGSNSEWEIEPLQGPAPPVGLLLPISRAHGDHTLGHRLVGGTLQAPPGSPPFTHLPSSCTRSDLRL